MKHGHISRNYAKAFFAFVTIGMAGACADSTVAPAPEAVAAFKAPAAFTRIGTVKTFRVRNTEGTTASIGAHILNIPAGAICSLTSSYGATEWDKPCTPLRGSVLITATVLYNDENQPYVDFQPAMRFAPNKEVTLYLRNGRSTHATQLNIDYCNNLGVCVDESLDDPSVKTFRVGRTSILGRRLKHFSGYVVNAGEVCAGSLSEDIDGSWICNTESMRRRSGYMVASGKDDDQGEDEARRNSGRYEEH